MNFKNTLVVAAIAAITIALVWRITALRGFVFGSEKAA